MTVQYLIPDDRKLGAAESKWVSQALIKGPSTVYVQDGSPVNFTCEISPTLSRFFFSGTPTNPIVRWLHEDKEIAFDVSIIHIYELLLCDNLELSGVKVNIIKYM